MARNLVGSAVVYFVVVTGVLALLRYGLGLGVQGGFAHLLVVGAVATLFWTVFLLGWERLRGSGERGGRTAGG